MVFPRVDDFIIARKEQCPEYKFRDYLVKTLHLERTDGDVWTYCGKTITVTPSAYLVSNQKAIMSLENIVIDRSRRAHDDDPVTEEERTAYRSAIGSLNYLTLWTRGDLQAAVSLAAQKTTRATVGDLKIVNVIIEEAHKTRDLQLTFRRASCEVAKATIVAWGDSAFANAERREKPMRSCRRPDRETGRGHQRDAVPALHPDGVALGHCEASFDRRWRPSRTLSPRLRRERSGSSRCSRRSSDLDAAPSTSARSKKATSLSLLEYRPTARISPRASARMRDRCRTRDFAS